MRNYRARGIKDGKPVFSEYYEQITVAAWLDFHKIFYIHVPNGELRNKAVAKKLKRMGVKPGCPDILIFDLNNVGKPTAVELKAVDGSPTNEQDAFLRALQANGWHCGLAFGAEAAIRWLESLGYGASTNPRGINTSGIGFGESAENAERLSILAAGRTPYCKPEK